MLSQFLIGLYIKEPSTYSLMVLYTINFTGKIIDLQKWRAVFLGLSHEENPKHWAIGFWYVIDVIFIDKVQYPIRDR